ncbi:hypothetical protein KM043_012384 [Ampulex compressa]|nr:hypothetical protein KM043_012384 [Ampulex compressa]
MGGGLVWFGLRAYSHAKSKPSMKMMFPQLMDFNTQGTGNFGDVGNPHWQKSTYSISSWVTLGPCYGLPRQGANEVSSISAETSSLELQMQDSVSPQRLNGLTGDERAPPVF